MRAELSLFHVAKKNAKLSLFQKIKEPKYAHFYL